LPDLRVVATSPNEKNFSLTKLHPSSATATGKDWNQLIPLQILAKISPSSSGFEEKTAIPGTKNQK